MERVVPFFKSFTTIFYFKYVDPGKVLFGSNKVWTVLNLYEITWISVWIDWTVKPCGTVARAGTSVARAPWHCGQGPHIRPPATLFQISHAATAWPLLAAHPPPPPSHLKGCRPRRRSPFPAPFFKQQVRTTSLLHPLWLLSGAGQPERCRHHRNWVGAPLLPPPLRWAMPPSPFSAAPPCTSPPLSPPLLQDPTTTTATFTPPSSIGHSGELSPSWTCLAPLPCRAWARGENLTPPRPPAHRWRGRHRAALHVHARWPCSTHTAALAPLAGLTAGPGRHGVALGLNRPLLFTLFNFLFYGLWNSRNLLNFNNS
jgi:hypothetical protein